jgi:ELWxxDGT repeat protein
MLQDTPAYTVSDGFVTTLYDAAGDQIIRIEDGGSMFLKNVLGNNTIHLHSESSEWSVYSDGSVAVFEHTNGDQIYMPAGTQSQTIAFADASTTLVIDESMQPPAITLGDQVVSSVVSSIDLTVAEDTTAPQFTSAETADGVNENTGADQVVYTAAASDENPVTYSLKDSGDVDSFSIDAATGEVTLLDDPDYATQPSYNFTVVATDSAGNASEQVVTLGVNQLNDEQTPWTLVMETNSDYYYHYNSDKDLLVSDGTASGTEEIDLSLEYGNSLVFHTTPDESGVYYYDASYGYLGYSDGSITNAVNLASNAFNAYFVSVSNEQIVIAGGTNVIVSDGSESGTTTQSTDFSIESSSYYSYRINDPEHQNLWFTAYTQPYGEELILFDYSPESGYPTTMVEDIGSGSSSGVYSISDSALLPDGRLIFRANDGIHGEEPWVSDGTEAGTFMLADLYTSNDYYSNPSQFTTFNNSVVFVATIRNADFGGSLGYELVVTDGTTAGTSVLDVNPGSSYSYPDILGQAGDLLYFTATDADGKGIFSTDGTDFTKLAPINSSASLLAWNETTAFFRVSATETGDELWAADLSGNTSAEDAFYLVRDILPGTGSALSSYPDVIEVGDSIAFNAYTSATNQSFFLSDGTDAGTIELASTTPDFRAVVGNTLIYAAADTLYSVDAGAATPSVTELLSGSGVTEAQNDANQAFILLENGELHATDGSSAATQKLATNVEDFKVVAEDAIFFVQDNTSGKSLWYSDGTTAGTRYIEEMGDNFYYNMDTAVGVRTFIEDDTTAPNFTSADVAPNIDENSGADQVVYTATAEDVNRISYSLKADNNDNAASFSINSSTGAVTLTEDPDYETTPEYTFTVVATDSAGNSSEQSVTLGINDIEDETAPVFTSPEVATSIEENSGADQVVYTAAADDDSEVTYSLKADNNDDAASFSINNTTGAVTLTEDPDYETTPEYSFTVVATDASGNASELGVTLGINLVEGEQTPWTLVMETRIDDYYRSDKDLLVSDGTASGTEEIDLSLGWGTDPLNFHATPDESGVYYFNDSNDYLGYSDGSVIDAVNLATDAFSSSFVSVSNEQIVIAGGTNVIVSDGTGSGTTTQSTDFSIYSGKNDPEHQNLWFAASTQPYGEELILFDYSPESGYSTTMVEDIWSGSSSGVNSFYESALLPDGRLVFEANDGVHGYEPWVSDGTEAGTFMLADLYTSNDYYSNPSQFTTFKNSVVFVAVIENADFGGYSGYELVITDGTTAGTSVLDVNPGGSSSSPTILGQAGDLLYFTATDADGKGIFSTDGTDFTKLAPINSSASLLAWNETTAFFRVSATETGDELWAADLSGNTSAEDAFYLVRDILPGTGSALSSYPDVIEVGDSIAFNAYTSATNQSFFLSDGTDAGTIELASTTPDFRAVVGNTLIYAAADTLYSVDAGAATPSVTELLSGSGVTEAQNDANQAFILLENGDFYASDGSSAATQKLATNVEDFKVVAEDAIFFVQNNTSGKSLWYSDGTTAGTRYIEEMGDNFYYNMDTAVGVRTVADNTDIGPDPISGLVDISGYKGSEYTLDLTSNAVATDSTLTVKVAAFDATANNKSDLGDGSIDAERKSDQTIKLPQLSDIDGTLSVENFTIATEVSADTYVINDVLTFNTDVADAGEAGYADDLAAMISSMTTESGDGDYITLDMQLTDGDPATVDGNLRLTNVIVQDRFDAFMAADDAGDNLIRVDAGVVSQEGVIALMGLMEDSGTFTFTEA